MFHKQTMIGRGQMGFYSLEDLVPQDHLLRHIDQYVDFDFIYDLVVDKYSLEHGRPSLDPVMLIKIPIIQYLFGIQSMRQTIKKKLKSILLIVGFLDLIFKMTCHISQLLVKIIADVSKTLTYLNRFSITFWIKPLRRN